MTLLIYLSDVILRSHQSTAVTREIKLNSIKIASILSITEMFVLFRKVFQGKGFLGIELLCRSKLRIIGTFLCINLSYFTLNLKNKNAFQYDAYRQIIDRIS